MTKSLSKWLMYLPKASLALCLGVVASEAFADPLRLTYDSFTESKTIGSPLVPGGDIRLDGRLRDASSVGGLPITNTLQFTAGSTALSLSAAWLIAPADNRTVGVNIDLFDRLNNLVASDLFLGATSTAANSQLIATGLTPGASYRLVITGSALHAGRYQIDMVDGASPVPVAAPAPVTPDPNHVLFDTHVGSENFGTAFANGSRVLIDGVIADDLLGGISNDFNLVVTSNTLSAGIEWIVRAGDPRRTTGVNVDLFDSFATLISTDQFMGLVDGEAFSQLLATGLAPGNYTLRLTGNAPLAGRYRIDLSSDATPPGFQAIDANPPASVPEPGTLALFAAALVCLVVGRRSTAR